LSRENCVIIGLFCIFIQVIRNKGDREEKIIKSQNLDENLNKSVPDYIIWLMTIHSHIP
jgi:hypothetical protein